MGRIACLGEGMIELVRGPDGGLGQGFGGDTMNTAVYLARLGIDVDFITALGDDPESDAMIALLDSEAVGTERILRVAGRLPGLYIIDVDASGERRFLYWRDRAPARELFTLPGSEVLIEALRGYDMLYLSGISLAIWGEEGRAVLFAALDGLRGRGVRIVFDSNWRPLLWPDLETARRAYGAMLERTDIALPGEHDLRALFGDADGDAILARMRGAGIAETCLRLAEPACVVAEGGSRTVVAAEAIAQVVDTTAAGDSFSAGYLAARLSDRTPVDAARAGHRLAGIVIQHRGAIVPRGATDRFATGGDGRMGGLDRSLPGTGPRRRVTILQIGGGNFLRGFFDWMIDVANERGFYDGGIAIAQTVGQDLATALAAQDMLYTVVVRGAHDGREIDERRIVGSVSDAFSTASGWSQALAYAASPALEILVSNTTESGIVDREEPVPGDDAPASFPAKVAALLHARFRALGGAPDTGLLVVPCELIERNGAILKRIVGAHARRWVLETAFLDWLESENHFVDTLVDRIVPGYPSGDIVRLEQEWGYRDPLAVAAEPFHLLVVQAPAELEPRLPLRAAGLDVVWIDDLEPYRVRKVRILNGAHTATALAAFLAGIDTVKAMIDDAQFASFLARVLDDEIVPFVPLADAERRSYARSVLERFANPYIQHDLIAISLNSTAKWKVRILPSIKDALAQEGVVPSGLAFSLAALIRFERFSGKDGEAMGLRDAGPYPIRDDAHALAAINAAWVRHASDMPALVADILGEVSIWGEDLNTVGELAARTASHLGRMETEGIRAALAAI